MSVPGIEAVGFTPYVPPAVPTPATPATGGVTGPYGPGAAMGTTGAGAAFGDFLVDGLDRMEAVQDRTDQLAVQAATGNLDNIHDYTLAATESSVTAQLTVAVRNRALEAFNEIMRMPVG